MKNWMVIEIIVTETVAMVETEILAIGMEVAAAVVQREVGLGWCIRKS